MYIPHHYKNEDIATIKAFLIQNSFGILINQVGGKPWATHIPLELDVDEDGNDILLGHIAKANPQWKSFKKEDPVLCIFNGPHAYISSSWYKEEEVPTWNYIAVHVYGTLSILTERELMESLHNLIAKHEKTVKNPVSLAEMSPKTVRQAKGVVGFKILITDIQAAYKLSQTRPEDHSSIISHLNERDVTSKEIARHIKHKNNSK